MTKNMTSSEVQVMHTKMMKPGNPLAAEHRGKDWKRCPGCQAAIRRLGVTVVKG